MFWLPHELYPGPLRFACWQTSQVSARECPEHDPRVGEALVQINVYLVLFILIWLVLMHTVSFPTFWSSLVSYQDGTIQKFISITRRHSASVATTNKRTGKIVHESVLKWWPKSRASGQVIGIYLHLPPSFAGSISFRSMARKVS